MNHDRIGIGSTEPVEIRMECEIQRSFTWNFFIPALM